MRRKSFSLIELLAVIVVILIIATLLAPAITSVKRKAHTAICANNLKQLGHLISVYALDNDDFLPWSGQNSYTDWKDGSEYYVGGRNHNRRNAYGNWAGHLLPYFTDLDLKDYSRGAQHQPIVFSSATQSMTMPAKSKSDPYFANYIVFQDMAFNGGYGPLKLLICPTANLTNDAIALEKGDLISRIAGITKTRGMISSYMGNGLFFGNKSNNSRRMQDLGSKGMLLGEGSDYGESGKYAPGLCFNAGIGGNASTTAGTFNMSNAYVGSNYIKDGNVTFSFMHDDTKEIWVSNKSRGASKSFITHFNKAYGPFAAASYDYGAPEHKKFTLASNIYPGEKWENFNDILSSFKAPALSIAKFHTEDEEFGYGFGDMNILSVDQSVSKRNIGWLYDNGRELTYLGLK